MQCVGATTLNEYRKYIEKDAALERRFQSVKVEAPSIEDAIEILKGLRHKYEEHHKAEFTDKAVEASVKLSDRYITDRFLPDKAIDVMDEAGSRARITTMTRPPEVKAMEAEIEEIKGKKEKAIKNQDFEGAAQMRDKEKQAKEKLETLLQGMAREGRRKTHRGGRRGNFARRLQMDGHPAPADGAGRDAAAARRLKTRWKKSSSASAKPFPPFARRCAARAPT